MIVSKELIEKYHSGQCTPDERKAVEVWLFDDESTPDEPILPLPAGESKSSIQDDMWQEISSVLPQRHGSRVLPFFAPFWRQAAAVLLLSLIGAAFYFNRRDTNNDVIVVSNTSDTANKDVYESAYSLSIGPKSNVEIDNETGRIEFCGTMMINPKRDIELTIQGTCVHPDKASEKIILKKGENYIALHYGNAPYANEVIILPQGSLNGLPPLMQRNLMMQFNI